MLKREINITAGPDRRVIFYTTRTHDPQKAVRIASASRAVNYERSVLTRL